MKKEIVIAWALSLVLVVGLCPGVAFASNDLAAGSPTEPQQQLEAQATKKRTVGKTFKYEGSTYKVTKKYNSTTDEPGTVELVKYGGTWKDLDLNSDLWYAFDPYVYDAGYWVTSIGANAFNTKQGRKVRSLELPVEGVTRIGKGAFKNMTALKTLDLTSFFHAYNYKSKAYKKIGSNAFKNAGKNKGSALTVYVASAAKNAKNAEKYKANAKKQLVKKGLAKKATVKLHYL